MEGKLAWLQLSCWDSQLLRRGAVQEIDVAASVDEHAQEAACMRIREHDGVLDQGVALGPGHDKWMVLSPPCDGYLGPVHVLGSGSTTVFTSALYHRSFLLSSS
jgi:hypothetical protein